MVVTSMTAERGTQPSTSLLLPTHVLLHLAKQIGSFEGGSALWFAQHLLKHPESRMVCLDTWEGSPEIRDVDMQSVEVSYRLGQLLFLDDAHDADHPRRPSRPRQSPPPGGGGRLL